MALCTLSSSVAVRHVHRPLTILHFNFFMKLTIVTDFNVKHFYGERKVNCHTHGFTNPEPQRLGQICKNGQFLKKSLLLKLWNSWSLLSWVQSLGRGQYSYIVKKCWFYNIFFCSATAVGVMHFLWRLL